MKIFACPRCHAVLFFENTVCLGCGIRLGFLPDRQTLSALEPMTGTGERFQALAAPDAGPYRACLTQATGAGCNWLVPADDDNPHCASCRLTRTIPDLAQPALRAAWGRLEAAKRRLCYGLAALGLPMRPRSEEGEHGLCFDFLAAMPGQVVTTGHDHGVITIDCAEADDAVRERTKAALGEEYRTLLGHLRHEVGHYYWDVLIRDGGILEAFRAAFGDERADYARAQETHYRQGPPDDWRRRHISAYASMHPWEDWAETWAHYLHLVDVVEVGAEFGLALSSRPLACDGDLHRVRLHAVKPDAFDDLIEAWLPLTYTVNSLNRSMGLNDWYPFTPSDAAVAKLRFVHETIHHAAAAAPAVAGAAQ